MYVSCYCLTLGPSNPTNGTKDECIAAPSSGPQPSFDVVRLQRRDAYVVDVKSYLTPPNSTCILCCKLLHGGKRPMSAQEWHCHRHCHHCHHGLTSSLSLAGSVKADLAIDTGNVSGGLEVAGTKSEMKSIAVERTKTDQFSFTTHQLHCTRCRSVIL